MSLTPKIYKTIQKNLLIPPNSTLLVAVSGGVDSLVLLHILRELRPLLRCALHVATLDHGLRGQAGADDAAFVVDVCQAWDIPVTSGTADVPALAAQQQLGIEAAARQARYAFLADTARQINSTRIVVAHHADDQAETILMHLIRGSGTQGLSGMRWQLPLPGHPGLTLLRPLLTTSRQEIEAYSQQHGLQPRSDATNQDTAYLRNRLRLEILPALRQINPAIHRALLHMADNAAADTHYISQQLQHIISDSVTSRLPASVEIERDVFRHLHPALQRHFLYWAAQTLNLPDLTHDHILHALMVANQGQPGARALLPAGRQLRVGYDQLYIESQSAAPAPPDMGPLLPSNFETYLSFPGIHPLTGTQWSVQVEAAPTAANAQGLAAEPDAIISLRTRRPGDRFTPVGLHGQTQKLSRWLVNHKIPREWRDFIPILVINGQIAAFYVNSKWIISQKHVLQTPAQPAIYVSFHESHN